MNSERDRETLRMGNEIQRKKETKKIYIYIKKLSDIQHEALQLTCGPNTQYTVAATQNNFPQDSFGELDG